MSSDLILPAQGRQGRGKGADSSSPAMLWVWHVAAQLEHSSLSSVPEVRSGGKRSERPPSGGDSTWQHYVEQNMPKDHLRSPIRISLGRLLLPAHRFRGLFIRMQGSLSRGLWAQWAGFAVSFF